MDNEQPKFPALKAWCETPHGGGQITEGPKQTKEFPPREVWYVTFAKPLDGYGKGKWFPVTEIKPLVR